MGSLAGSALFPTQLPPGPKISDNRTTTSVVGGPVSLVFGTASLSGTVMWLAPFVQTTNNSAKGGPNQQTFTYTQSIAIGLAERVDDDAPDNVGAIGGITRIWENGAIVYDVRPQQQASSELNTLAETDQEYANRLTASAAYAETFTLYLGDELQEPDPTIEAVQGVGTVPPFRALAYIVYPNRALSFAQGLRHPNFQFEVFQNGVGTCTSNTVTSNEQLFPWVSGGANPENSRNKNEWTIQFFDVRLGPGYFSGNHLSWNTQTFTNAADLCAFMQQFYGVPMSVMGYRAASGIPSTGHTGAPQVSGGQSVAPDPNSIEAQLWFDLPSSPTDFVINTYAGPYLEGHIYFQDTSSQATVKYMSGPPTTEGGPACPTFVLPYTYVQELTPVFPWDFSSLMCGQGSDCAMVTCVRSPNAPPDPCLGLPPSLIPGFSIQLDGSLVKCGPWTRLTSPIGQTTFKVLQKYVASGGFANTTSYPLNPGMPAGDPNDTMATWTAAYADAVTRGWMPAGLTYKATESGPGDYPVWQNFLYTNDLVICQAIGNRVSIADIIVAICKRSGLRAVDASDLDAVFVNGYAISSVCSGSAIITPLRSIGFFDCIETNGLIKFATRGKPIVATLTTDDIGAYDQTQNTTNASGASTCPPSVTATRSQEEDLPRSIRFHYIATSRDYEDGEQSSLFRFATKAVNDVDITVPVCLDDTQAAQCASVLWADAWAAQTAYETAVDQSWTALDGGDCIGVPVDGVIERIRIASDTNSSGVLRKLSCVKDEEGAYISFAVATPPARIPQKLSFIGATVYELLDLPCLQDADSDPGFYVAAQRSGAGTWKGATFYESTDGGATFTTLFSLLEETTAGTIAGDVPASSHYTWDTSTEITVTLPSANYSFESVTDDAVLYGANAAAMGADGRWEIVQFADAVQLAPTVWRLSRLLRGRRGTEHVMGSSRLGDQFIMVSTGTIGRVVLDAAEIGAARVYRGASIGASFNSGNDQTFVGHGEALECFSPVNAIAERLTDGDISISWIRRSRLGRTLMSGVDIPLGEASESFQVDILEAISPASPEIVLRTLASSTTSVLYSHAHQETDFGSPLPATLRVAIYQLSAITGRGTPLLATLTVE